MGQAVNSQILIKDLWKLCFTTFLIGLCKNKNLQALLKTCNMCTYFIFPNDTDLKD